MVMIREGHIEDGKIVLDEPVNLKDGTKVRVEVIEESAAPRLTSLRGTPYKYDDPFKPALDESDWDAMK